MKYGKILRLAKYLVVIGLFNLIFFLWGDAGNVATFWVAYAMVHVAVLVSYIAPVYCINYRRVPENLSTIYVFAWLYTILSMALNVIYIFVKIDHLSSCIIFNAVLLGAYIIQLIVNLKVNYEVETSLEHVEAERQFVREVSAELKLYMNIAEDTELKEVLEKAYDAVRTSPLHSSENVMQYELEIIRLAKELEVKVENQLKEEAIQISNQIIKNVQKRNSLL